MSLLPVSEGPPDEVGDSGIYVSMVWSVGAVTGYAGVTEEDDI